MISIPKLSSKKKKKKKKTFECAKVGNGYRPFLTFKLHTCDRFEFYDIIHLLGSNRLTSSKMEALRNFKM